MTDNLQFAQLLEEFRRVGVDPDTFSAVIAVTPDEALQVLRSLPEDAGPAAFLNRLRHEREMRLPGAGAPSDAKPSAAASPPPQRNAASPPATSPPDSAATDGVRRRA